MDCCDCLPNGVSACGEHIIIGIMCIQGLTFLPVIAANLEGFCFTLRMGMSMFACTCRHIPSAVGVEMQNVSGAFSSQS